MTEALPIVDAHHHLWDLDRHHYPWLSNQNAAEPRSRPFAALARNYLAADFLRDAAAQPLMASVHVDAGFDPADPVAESRWLQEVADQTGFPQAIIAHARPHEPDFEAVLAGHAQFANVRGIRHRINWHSDPAKSAAAENFLENDRWLAGYPLLEKFGFSFELQIFPAQVDAAIGLIRRYPGIPVMVAHAGHPIDRSPEMLALWRAGIAKLAALDHVWVKISGLSMYDPHWTVDSFRPFICHLIECFGTHRAAFASNFPVDGLFSSYDRLWDAYREIIAPFSTEEKRRLLALNAKAFYRI